MEGAVSVILPTFKRPHLLPVAVRCVLAQKWRPLEVVVINDGSPDDTPAVMQSLAPEVEAAGCTAAMLHQQNRGVAAARNLGLARATGRWVAFLDDDDRWAPHKLECQMKLLAESGAGGACALSLVVQEGGTFDLVPERDQKLLQGFCPAENLRAERHAHINTLVVDATACRAAGPFDDTLSLAEDIDWIARLCHEVTWCAVPEVLHSYDRTRHAGALTHEVDRAAVARKDEIRERMVLGLRAKLQGRRGWDEAAWRLRVGLEFRAFVRHALKLKRYSHAVALFARGMEASGGAQPLAELSGKVLKARIKRIFQNPE